MSRGQVGALRRQFIQTVQARRNVTGMDLKVSEHFLSSSESFISQHLVPRGQIAHPLKKMKRLLILKD